MKYKTIDLCAGIGGIRRGFELAGGFENVLSAEIDPFAAETYKGLFNNEDPTNDLTTEEFKEKVANTDYDVLLAGFPCQAFSRVGLRKGFRDTTRGTIFFSLADIISRTQPRAVFLENVEGLLYHDKGHTMEVIINTLENELRYRVIGVTLSEDGTYEYSRESFVRNTKDFGLPQNRPRAYIMAFNKDIYSSRAFKLLDAQLPLKSDKIIFEDLNAILEKEVADKYYMAKGYLETLKNHRKRQEAKGYGFGYCVVNEIGIVKPIASTILATGGSGKERNLIRQPKDGVAGKIIGEKKTPLNSEGIRVMTPTEWGKLQGFIGYAFVEDGIDRFCFPDGMTDGQKYKQLGNSVSIPVIEELAKYMLRCFDTLENYQEKIIKAEALKHDYLSNRIVMEALDISLTRAKALLEKMADQKELLRVKRGNKTRYMLYPEDQSHVVYPPFNQKEAVIAFAKTKETFTNADVVVLLGATKNSAHVLLSTLVKEGRIRRITRGIYAKDSNQRDAVIALAKIKSTFTNDDVVTMLNTTENNAHVLLSTLVKEGHIQRISRGIYAEIDPSQE